MKNSRWLGKWGCKGVCDDMRVSGWYTRVGGWDVRVSEWDARVSGCDARVGGWDARVKWARSLLLDTLHYGNSTP